MTTVYRVYETYHYDSGSGTYEYGIFSTRSLAATRVDEVWKYREYPDTFTETEHGRFEDGGWPGEACNIKIAEIILDEKVNNQIMGWT